MSTEIKEDVDVDNLLENLVSEENMIIVYNDDVNTFDHVTECLMRYCGHDAEMAGVMTLMIHMKGRFPVKKGSYKNLVPICSSLLENGLSAEIE